jgi:hypothetical protein
VPASPPADAGDTNRLKEETMSLRIEKGSWLFLAATLLLLSACGDPHERVLPKDLTDWKDDLKSELQSLPPGESELLTNYAKRYNSGTAGRPPEGVTVRQAIAAEREYEAAQARKEAAALAAKEQATREREMWRQQFERALTVGYVGKKLEKAGFSGDFLTVVVAVKNTGTRTITGFKGRVEFFNASGGEITHEDIDYKQPIPAGKSFEHEVRMYRMPEGIYKDPATSSDQMRFHYKAKEIDFADGDKVVLPKELE